MPTVSLEADRFKSTVAPRRAREMEGGSGAHRSSQISTPITRLGMLSQAKIPLLFMHTACPHSWKSSSTPLTPPEGLNHRCS